MGENSLQDQEPIAEPSGNQIAEHGAVIDHGVHPAVGKVLHGVNQGLLRPEPDSMICEILGSGRMGQAGQYIDVSEGDRGGIYEDGNYYYCDEVPEVEHEKIGGAVDLNKVTFRITTSINRTNKYA